MVFRTGSSRDGGFVQGLDAWWERERNGGHYDRGHGFLWVHWEAKDRDPGTVRLHVEAPKRSVEPELGDLKQRLINAVLESPLTAAARAAGLECRLGPYVSKAMENKSATVLLVTLPTHACRSTHAEDITTVHGSVGAHLDAVMEQFAAELDLLFGSP